MSCFSGATTRGGTDPVFMASSDKPTAASPLTDIEALREFCATASFRPGDVLREQGQYYRSMYWLTDGSANVEFKDGSGPRATSVGAGWPIGEISFLRGSPAVATVTAAEPTSALVIDNVTLARLEREEILLHIIETTAKLRF